MVIIGGGLLGLEAGNALRKMGKKVMVVAFFPRLLPRQLDVDGAKRLQGIMEGMGFSFQCRPTGAFYVFAHAAHLNPDCYRLAFDILEKAGVGVTPGVDFGRGGEGYIRFTYANSLENIKRGMDRLEAYVADLGRAPWVARRSRAPRRQTSRGAATLVRIPSPRRTCVPQPRSELPSRDRGG